MKCSHSWLVGPLSKGRPLVVAATGWLVWAINISSGQCGFTGINSNAAVYSINLSNPNKYAVHSYSAVFSVIASHTGISSVTGIL